MKSIVSMKNVRLLSVLLILLFLSLPLHSKRNAHSFEFDLFDDPELNHFAEEYNWNVTRNKQDVIDLLEDIGFIELLKEPLFLHTNLLNNRNIPDLPFSRNTLTYFPCVSKYKPNYGFKKFGFSLYYNETPRMVFEKSSTNISSYLAIQEDSFLDKLEALIQKLDILIPGLGIDPFLIADLFKNFTVQERRAGAYFSAAYALPTSRKMILGINLPLCYCERNHFLTEGETARIEQELGTPSIEPQDQEAFQDKHFISDRIGIGDMRITLDTPIHKSAFLQAVGSIFCTVPTAQTFANGVLRGSKFCPVTNRPTFDLSLLLNDAARADGTLHIQLEEFLLCALDNLNSMLLDTRLGNHGHFGLGFALYLKSHLDLLIKRPWAENFRMKSRYSAEFLFPATETRYFITCSDLHDFDIRDFNNQNQTESNFAFLTETLTNRLFPFALPARISPPPILRSTTNLTYSNGRIQWDIGTDTWIWPREGLYVSSKCTHSINHALNEYIAKRPFAYQGKLFTSLAYNHSAYESIWTFSIFIDKTFTSSGIGKDFTIALGIHGSF